MLHVQDYKSVECPTCHFQVLFLYILMRFFSSLHFVRKVNHFDVLQCIKEVFYNKFFEKDIVKGFFFVI